MYASERIAASQDVKLVGNPLITKNAATAMAALIPIRNES